MSSMLQEATLRSSTAKSYNLVGMPLLGLISQTLEYLWLQYTCPLAFLGVKIWKMGMASKPIQF